MSFNLLKLDNITLQNVLDRTPFCLLPGTCCSCCQITCLHVFYDFRVKTMFDSSWLPFVLYGFMFYLCYLYLFTYIGAQRDFHIRWCLCRLIVTRLMLHVVHALLTLQKNMRSSPAFGGFPVARCSFYVISCWSLFVLFRLVMMLSVLLRLTVYPFGIFWSWCCLYFFD